MHASSFYLEYFDIMPQNTLAFCRAGCDVRRVENENPKGLARICSLPKSLVGRTLFLGLLTGVFSGFSFGAWKCACRAAETLWNGSGLAFESRAAAASHAVRSVAGAFVFVLNSAALSCAAFAAEWLLIYSFGARGPQLTHGRPTVLRGLENSGVGCLFAPDFPSCD